MDKNKDHEDERKEFWRKVYIAYVSSSNSTDVCGGQYWADKALQEFDARFPEEKIKK